MKGCGQAGRIGLVLVLMLSLGGSVGAQSLVFSDTPLSEVLLAIARAKGENLFMQAPKKEARATIDLSTGDPMEMVPHLLKAQHLDLERSPHGLLIGKRRTWQPVLEQPIPTRAGSTERISLDFRDVRIQDLFVLIARKAQVNILQDKGIRDRVTVRAADLPWETVVHQLATLVGARCQWLDNVLVISRQPLPSQMVPDFPEAGTGRLTVSFQDTDIRQIFRCITRTAGCNLIVDPVVRGNVSVNLGDVSAVTALFCLAVTQGFDVAFQGNTCFLGASPTIHRVKLLVPALHEPESRPTMTTYWLNMSQEQVYGKLADFLEQSVATGESTTPRSLFLDVRDLSVDRFLLFLGAVCNIPMHAPGTVPKRNRARYQFLMWAGQMRQDSTPPQLRLSLDDFTDRALLGTVAGTGTSTALLVGGGALLFGQAGTSLTRGIRLETVTPGEVVLHQSNPERTRTLKVY